MFHLLGLFLFCVSPGHNYYIYFSYTDDIENYFYHRGSLLLLVLEKCLMFWAEISQGAFELKNIDPLNLNANSTESSFKRTSSSLLNQRCQKRKKNTMLLFTVSR